MQIAPQPWTHDHTHRLFHISLGLCLAFILGTMMASIAVAWWQTNASNDAVITANVEEVEPGPTVVISDPGPSAPPAAQPPKPAPPQKPEVSVLLESPNTPKQTVQTPDGPVDLPVFNTRKPVFSGKTNIPNALIFLEVHSEPVLYGTAQADAEGQWQWFPPEDLLPGAHKILVTARSPDNAALSATFSFDFYINPNASGEALKPIVPAGTAFLKNVFGVFVNVFEQYKVVPPGGQVVAALRFYSPDLKDPRDIKYTVVGPDNDTIFEVTENIPAGKEVAFRKSFITRPNARPGTYKVTVKIPHLLNTAIASDTFEVSPINSAIALPGNVLMAPLALTALGSLLLLFMLLTVLTYHKVTALTYVIKQQNLPSSPSTNKPLGKLNGKNRRVP